MAVTNSFVAGTLIESAKVNENFDDVATGDGDETENSLRTFRDESLFDHVVSGGVITDPGASLTQTTTSLVAVIDGRRVTIDATAKTYTASKDTYVDVLRSGTTASYVYTEVANNAASPALASNSIRLAIVITNGTEITQVNQGNTDATAPVASSVVYTVCDSLGNLIYPSDPQRRILGYRRVTSDATTTSTSYTSITGLTVPVIVPSGRRVRLSLFGNNFRSSSAGSNVYLIISKDGVPGTGTQMQLEQVVSTGADQRLPISVSVRENPTSGSHTYYGGFKTQAGTLTLEAATTYPLELTVELV